MKPPCEVIVKLVLPMARSMIARDLIQKHGLTQREAARRLGITQPAISQYKQHLRGQGSSLQKDPDFREKIEEISEGLASKKLDMTDASTLFCDLCKDMRKKGLFSMTIQSAGRRV